MNEMMLLAQSVNDRWAEVFFGLDQNQRFVILIVAIGCVTGVICTVVGCATGAISSLQRQRMDAEMKREMLDRGMSAEEIAQVIESKQPKDFLEHWAASCRKKKVG